MVARDDLLELLYGRAGRRIADTHRDRPAPAEPQPEEEFLDLEPAPEEQGVPFPIDALPIGLSTFVLETARAMEVEVEMVAIPALVALGAAIGDSRCLQLKPGYSESAEIWATVVARPGSVKTSAILAAAEPLRRYERHLDAENRRVKREYEREMEDWQATKVSDRRGLARPEEPQAKRQIVRDVTMEELAFILRDNERGLLMLQDEISGWVRGMNQYKAKGSDRSNWLSIWSSVEMTVDRRSAHGDPLRVWHPFVALTGGIQPDLLRELRPENGADDGLIDRLLFAWPAQRVRRWTDAYVAQNVINDYRRTFAALLALGMQRNDLDFTEPVPVRMDPAAKLCWVDLYNQHHAEMAGADFEARLHGAYAKLDAYAARLALVLQLTRIAAEECEPVEMMDMDSIEAAWQIVGYFKHGAARVYGQMGMNQTDRQVRAAIEWMDRHCVDELTARDCLRAGVANIKTLPEIDTLFNALRDRGYGLTTGKAGPKGNKDGLRFRRSRKVWTEGTSAETQQ